MRLNGLSCGGMPLRNYQVLKPIAKSSILFGNYLRTKVHQRNTSVQYHPNVIHTIRFKQC